MGYTYIFITFLLLFILINGSVKASAGDRAPYYIKCNENCSNANCTKDGENFNDPSGQPVLHRILLWKCIDECRYNCMWKTVNAFIDRGWDVPKFHGKWPFIRVLGVQELGSVLGSILNLATHAFMFNKLKNSFSTKNTPLLWVWYIFSAVCMHAWVWSIIFHTRDTLFTEFMDYAAALSMVLATVLSFVVRALYGKSKIYSWVIGSICLLLYIDYAIYLYSGRIDYDFNMIFNIAIGAVGFVCWTIWAIWQLRSKRQYVWRLIIFYMLTVAVLALEVLDFPPYMYLWDAHAIWHLSTAPLPLLFYRFVMDDLAYLRLSWPELQTSHADLKLL